MQIHVFEDLRNKAEPLDEAVFSAYQKDPWKVARSLRRLFVAVEDLNEEATIYAGVLNEDTGELRWHQYPHALIDGLGFVEKLIEKKALILKFAPDEENKNRNNLKPPTFADLWRRMKKRKAVSRGFRKERMLDEKKGDPFTGAILFDESQTRLIEKLADESKGSLNSFLLKKMTTLLDYRSQLWMFSASVRGSCDSMEQIQSSYFFLTIAPEDNESKVREKIKAAFTTREPIENYYLGKLISKLPRFLIKKITEIEFRSNMQELVGLYTNLGAYQFEGNQHLFLCPSVRAARPFSIIASSANRKLNLSIVALRSCFESRDEFERWLKSLGNLLTYENA